MTVMGIERKCKSHISITGEKDMTREDVDEEDEEATETVPEIDMMAKYKDIDR